MRMSLRHLLLISGVVLALAVLYNLYSLKETTTAPRHLVLQDAYSAQLIQQQAQPLATVHCPDVPPSQDVLLDFCSPKDHGDVAGPYGAHIVLAGENIPANPDTWVLVKDQQISDPATLSACVGGKQGCFAFPAPKNLGTEQNKTVYAFTWSGPAFPTQTGDYYVEAFTGRISHPDQLQVIASTPVAFSLLTSQAPCISLAVGDGTPTTCNTSSQNFSVQLTTASTTTLTISGANWLLGWKPKSANEQVEVTATCLASQACTPKTLFDVEGNVDMSGAFSTSVSLPAHTSGTYKVSAVNHVPQVANPLQSDYTKSDNSIADGSLIFGTSTGAGALTIDVLPPPIVIPTPIFRPAPTATSHGNGGGGGNIADSRLELYALGAALPAFIGIIAFFLIWVYLRRSALRLAPSLAQNAVSSTDQQMPSSTIRTASSPIKAQHISPPSQQEENVSATLAINFILNEAQFLPFPPAKVQPQLPVEPSRLSFLNLNAEKEIKQALKQWQRHERLKKAMQIAPILLSQDFTLWETFCEQLSKSPVKYKHAMREIQVQEQHAYNAIRMLQQPDAKNFLGLGSKALVYYAALLSLTDSGVMYKAAIQYLMGFAYVELALHTSYLGNNLLQAARRYYISALDIVNDNYANVTVIHDFLSIIFVAIGDVNVAMAQLSQTPPETNAYEHLVEALNVYDQAQNVVVTQTRQAVIQSRLVYVKGQIGSRRR